MCAADNAEQFDLPDELLITGKTRYSALSQIRRAPSCEILDDSKITISNIRCHRNWLGFLTAGHINSWEPGLSEQKRDEDSIDCQGNHKSNLHKTETDNKRHKIKELLWNFETKTSRLLYQMEENHIPSAISANSSWTREHKSLQQSQELKHQHELITNIHADLANPASFSGWIQYIQKELCNSKERRFLRIGVSNEC